MIWAITEEGAEDDGRLSALLRGAAPAPSPRDALFRLQVLERRERNRFQRRARLAIAAGVMVAAVAVAGLATGGEARVIATVALACVALALGGVELARGPARLLRLRRA